MLKMNYDDEINVVILDEKVTAELNDHFLEDIENSEKVEIGKWKERSPIKKISEKITGLFRQEI